MTVSKGKGLPGAWEPEWNPGPTAALAAAPRCFRGAWVSREEEAGGAQGRVESPSGSPGKNEDGCVETRRPEGL